MRKARLPSRPRSARSSRRLAWSPLDIRWLDTFRRPSVAFKQTFHLFMATRFRQVGPVEAGIEVNEFTFTDVAKLLDVGELIEQFTVYGKLRKLLQDGSVGGR